MQGTLYIAGGVGEIAVGVPLAILTFETGVGFYGGLLLVLHGSDQIIKGSGQILTNQKQKSLTTAALEQCKVPPEWAETIDDLMGAGGALAAGSRLLMRMGDDVLEVTVKELVKVGGEKAPTVVRGEVKLIDKPNLKPHVDAEDFGKKVTTAAKVDGEVLKAGTESGGGYKHGIDIDVNLLNREINLPDNLNSPKLRAKFNDHRKDFGMEGMNFNRENAELFKERIRAHINDPDTIPIGGRYTTGGVGNVVHYYNPKTELNVMKDMNGDFVSGWKLGENQQKYLKQKAQIGVKSD